MNEAKVITLSLDIETKIVDIMAVFDMRARNVTIYEWLPNLKRFGETKGKFHINKVIISKINRTFLYEQ